MKVTYRNGSVVALALAGAVAIACAEEQATQPVLRDGSTAHLHSASHGAVAMTPALERELDVVRRATKAYQSFAVAQKEKYTVALTPCMEDSTLGGMGFHYGKGALIDGRVELKRPELLLYEPQADGSLQLVGIEWIVPFTAWNKPNPPRLLGVDFAANQTFQVWALHAWIWRTNPSGALADWNPTVSCAHATQS
jgi:hypothetical protein